MRNCETVLKGKREARGKILLEPIARANKNCMIILVLLSLILPGIFAMDPYRYMATSEDHQRDYYRQPHGSSGMNPQTAVHLVPGLVPAHNNLVVVSHANRVTGQPIVYSNPLHHSHQSNQASMRNFSPVRLSPAAVPLPPMPPPLSPQVSLDANHQLPPYLPSHQTSHIIPQSALPPPILTPVLPPAPIGITADELAVKHDLQTQVFDNQLQQIMNQLPRLPSGEMSLSPQVQDQPEVYVPTAQPQQDQPSMFQRAHPELGMQKKSSIDSFGSFFDAIPPEAELGMSKQDIDELFDGSIYLIDCHIRGYGSNRL